MEANFSKGFTWKRLQFYIFYKNYIFQPQRKDTDSASGTEITGRKTEHTSAAVDRKLHGA